MLSLALGIGANAAIFTFIDALLLRPLPVRDPSSLVDVSAMRHDKWALLSFPRYRDLAERQQVLTGIVATAGETPTRVTIRSAGGAAAEVDNVRISFGTAAESRARHPRRRVSRGACDQREHGEAVLFAAAAPDLSQFSVSSVPLYSPL